MQSSTFCCTGSNKFHQVHCIATLIAGPFIEDSELTDFPDAVNKASPRKRKKLYLSHKAILQSLIFNITSAALRVTLRNIQKRYTNFVTLRIDKPWKMVLHCTKTWHKPLTNVHTLLQS